MRCFPETVDTSTSMPCGSPWAGPRRHRKKRTRIAELERQILDDLSLQVGGGRATIGDETAPALEAKAKSLEADLDLAEERMSTATVARANAERDLGQ